jgi:hypothetical protein
MQRLFLALFLPANSGLSLASFVACYAEGRRFRNRKRRWLTRMQAHPKEGRGERQSTKGPVGTLGLA